MNSFGRSLAASGALVVAAVVSLLVMAAPADPKPDVAGPAASAPVERQKERGEEEAPAAPVTFSDPDGQELILEDLSVRAAIHGMLSLTEMEFRFRNPQARRIEGRFACTLPADATISRFAKDVNGHLMEGEVVERLRANQVYEQFLHQMRDPALLEQEQGNRFSARIFPIEGNAEVRLILSYTRLLPLRGGVRRYTLPLRGLQEIDRFSFRAIASPLPGEERAVKPASAMFDASGADVRTADVITLEERAYTPQRDIELTWRPRHDAPPARILRAGDFYLASFQPNVVTATSAAPTGSWIFYVDTSASSAESADHRIRALELLLAALPTTDHVVLRAFDQEIVSLGAGTASEMARSIRPLLRGRLFLGGTDLGAVLQELARAPRDATVVVASDLVPTVGETDRKALNDRIRAIHGLTLHALILGSRQDAPMARALTAGRGRVVSIPFSEGMRRQAGEAAEELRRPVGPSVTFRDPSAEWIYPARIDDVRRGDEVIVLGRTKAGADPMVQATGAALPAAGRASLPAGAYAPLLEREAYRAYLDHLAEREAAEESEAIRRALAAEQVRVSVEQRVVIPRTTMLVLESEWEYRRFGLDRRALADILTIDAAGIMRIDRRGDLQPSSPQPVPRPLPVPVLKRGDRQFREEQPSRDQAADAARPDESKVEGGVMGGVVGGVVGSAVSSVATMYRNSDVRESSAPLPPASNASPAAPPPPPNVVAQEPERSVPAPALRRERTYSGPWNRPRSMSKEEVADLARRLAENRREREIYNQMSEALAARGEWKELRDLALEWQPYDPENPQVYEVLAMAGEKLGKESEAARAAASLIEVAPGKPELLQRAGLLLVRLGRASVAEAPLRRALEIRPDRVNGYRHLAIMLWLDGRHEEAARVLESATNQTFPGWYGNAQRVIREELVYVYRAWAAHEPSRRAEIEERATRFGADLDYRDALRVTLSWETDANDVDLHVVDPSGEECSYRNPRTAAGLELYEDITQGLGPEVIRTASVERGTYHVGVRYFNAGPMGVSRGIVIVTRSQRGGAPSVEIHPFRLVEGGGEIRHVAAVSVK